MRESQRMTDEQIMQCFRDASEQKLGDIGESVLSAVLKSSGFHYIPLSKIDTGSAPMSESKNGRVVLPDIQAISTNGELIDVFIDAKCKTGPVFWRKTSQWRHGIDRKNWIAYRRCGELYRKQCGIGIVELFENADDTSVWSGRIWCESLKNLGEPYAGESNQSHMVYWRQKQFCNLDTFSPSELLAIAKGKLTRSYDIEFENIFAPRRQRGMFE